MKPYTLLYIASGWIIFVALLALPRGLKSILVIVGGMFVFVIAYGMHQKVRHKYLEGVQKKESPKKEEPAPEYPATESVQESAEISHEENPA